MSEALLSPYSEVFYNQWKIDKNRTDYNIVFDQNLKGDLDVVRLKQAVLRFIDGNLIFNSHIVENIKGELCWKKNNKIEEIDFFANKESEIISNKRLLDYISAPFNLETGPLYRFALIQNEKYDYRFIIVLHHIVIDRNLFDYFIDELSKYYNNLEHKSILSLEEQVKSLNKLSKEQKRKIESNREKVSTFWNEKLSKTESIDFSFLKWNNFTQGNNSANYLLRTYEYVSLQELANIAEIRFNFNEKVLSQVEILKEKFNISSYWYGQIIYALLLNKYTGQNNFCISYPISMSKTKSFTFGSQTNTSVIPYNFDSIDTFQGLIKYILKVQDLKNNILPIYDILEFSNKSILSSLFAQINLKEKKLYFGGIDILVNNSSIDLVDNIVFEQAIFNNKLNFRVKFKLDYFDETLVENYVESYKKLFIEILNDLVNLDIDFTSFKFKNYLILTKEQHHKIINEWNDTDKDYPRDKPANQLFEEQAEKTPDAIALVYDDIKLTYRELNSKANQLAHYLVKQKVMQETIVAVCLDKSIDLVISLMAILKTGGVYLPLDLKLPVDRIKFILNDTSVSYVITNLEYWDIFSEYNSKVIKLDYNKINFFNEELNNLNIDVFQDNGAYITYTSGTTGTPKGITNTVQGLMNHLLWTIDNYVIEGNDSFLQLASIGFDISVWEMLFPLLKGAKLLILGEEKCKDIDYIINIIENERITIIHFVPSLLKVFLDYSRSKDCVSIRKVVCGGEHLGYNLKEKFFDVFPNAELYHAYGPTEASISVTHWNCRDNELHGKVPIGKPISNTKIYILSHENMPLPVGAIGELCIGGVGLAKGYLNLPELTAERFVPNPFQTEGEKEDKTYGLLGKNSKLYKTGDLARWLPDGNIEYIGRNDSQVKIRGYRIELGEIESLLSNYKGIKQAVVVDKENIIGDKTLVAYLVNNSMSNLENKEPRLWPSIAEYFVYDNLIYDILTNDTLRNSYYKYAIKRHVEDKVVLDIGTGKDAILARFCIESGARKVYAIEYLEKPFNEARETLVKLGLEDKITLIHGDAIKVILPEKVDLVVSEIVGPIGSMEGAVNILNDARERHLKPSGITIPRISNTYIAAVQFPNILVNNYFEPIPKSYVNKIFASSGYCFDLRVGIENFPNENIISSSAVFEHLNFNSFVEPESTEQVTLFILKDGYIDGFLLWLNLEIDVDILIDTLEQKTCWIPIYFPVFEERIYVKENDVIYLKCSRILSENKLNPDYYIEGKISRVEADDIIFNYVSKHYNKNYKGNKFYQDLFDHMNQRKGLSEISNEINFKEPLKEYLKGLLPDYMIPDYYVPIEKIPLTVNGKLDRKALPDPEFINRAIYVAPRNKLEKRVRKICAEVLGLPEDKIGIKDNFFRLGINSIVAMKLINRINKELRVDLRILILLKNNTIQMLAEHIKGDNKEKITKKIIITQVEQQRLSFAQERLWFLNKYTENRDVYNLPWSYKIPKSIDLAILIRSIKSLVCRQEILRSVIKEDIKGNSYQLVLDSDILSLKINTITVSSQDKLDDGLKIEAHYQFDLSVEYPIRICLYKLNTEYYISIVIHHIAFDGWSNEIFLRELKEYYRHYLCKKNKTESQLRLPKLTMQYRDFALWQRYYLRGRVLAKQLNFWQRKLKDYQSLNLLIDKTRASSINYCGRNIDFELDKDVSLALRNLAKELEVSLYTVLLSGYYLMLKTYSNQDDIIIGMPLTNRHYSQVEHLIGFFINILPLRIKIRGQELIKEFITKVSKEITLIQFYQDLPFEKLVEQLNLKGDNSRHPIFQVIFRVQNFSSELNLKKSGDNLNSIDFLEPYYPKKSIYNIARFDLNTLIDDGGTILKGNFNYAVSLYQEKTIRNFIGTYKQILKQFAQLTKKKDKLNYTKVSDIYYLGKEQYTKIIYSWNNTSNGSGVGKTVQKLFEEQTEKTPDRIAIICEGRQFTYHELNKKANRLAHYLIVHYNITPGALIALCLDNNEYLIIGMLAILKSGGTYVPVDPSYPDDRVEYILGDARIKLILSLEVYKSWLMHIHTWKVDILPLDSAVFNKKLFFKSVINPDVKVVSNNLANLIYTSGATGRPKGVMIEHIGITSLVKSIGNLPIDYKDIFIQLSDIASDILNFNIWCCLLNGARLYIPDKSMNFFSNNQLFSRVLTVNNISVLAVTKTLFEHLFLIDSVIFDKLNYLLVSGEVLNKEFISQLVYSRNRPKNIINCYGPTENTTFSCLYNITKETIKSYDTIPIGNPLSNIKAYVLDNSLVPLPLGAVGELYLGGRAIARGYLNQPGLTAEKFIANPFQSEEERKSGLNKRLYMTGDLARWLPGGNLEYVGRIDSQVQINGHRIELAEVEMALSNCYLVKQCAVVVQEYKNHNKYLVGYYISDAQLNEEDIKKEILSCLQAILPKYMLPSKLVQIDKMPLTISGKLDRKALQDPNFKNKEYYVKPKNKIQINMCKIWSEILGLPEDKVSIKEDFFRMGGHSITSILLINKINQKFKIKLSVKDIFAYRSIERIYDEIISKKILINTVVKDEQGILSGAVKLAPIQEWFFKIINQDPGSYVKSFVVKVPELDIEKLQKSINKLVEYHDSLRLRYKKVGERKHDYIQYYDIATKAPELKYLDLRRAELKEDNTSFNSELDKIFKDWHSGFDITRGSIFSIGYIFGYRDGSARLYIALHYLITDTVSCRILLEDLAKIYSSQDLGLKGSSYRQWVGAVEEYKQLHNDEMYYWHNILNDYNFVNSFFVKQDSVIYRNLKFTKQKTKILLQKSNESYNTEIKDLLLTAVSYGLTAINNSKVHHISLKSNVRKGIDSSVDVTRTIGLFTTIYPIRIEISQDIGRSIKNVKECLRHIPNNAIGYGVMLGHGTKELPNITFDYIGEFNTKKESENFWCIVEMDRDMLIDESNVLDISGVVIDEVLQVNVASKLGSENTNKFIEILTDRLEKLISYCLNKEHAEHTMSDFKDYTPYLLYNTKNLENDRIFLLPPGHGGEESYINTIVPILPNKNLVLLGNYYKYLKTKYNKNSILHITIEMLAENYICNIKSLQSKGPYNLFGWSFGGVLAFEIMRQLIDNGDVVHNLILLDSYFNLKKVVDKLGIKTFKNDISYKYSPKQVPKTLNLKIILFKVTQKVNFRETKDTEIHDILKISDYITENTTHNNLEDFLEDNLIDVVLIDEDSHSSLINNKSLHRFLRYYWS